MSGTEGQSAMHLAVSSWRGSPAHRVLATRQLQFNRSQRYDPSPATMAHRRATVTVKGGSIMHPISLRSRPCTMPYGDGAVGSRDP